MDVQTQFDSLAQLLPTVQALKNSILSAAKVMPVVILVPAFGLRALPWGARVGLAVTLGFSVIPALSQPSTLPLGPAIAIQVVSGLPIALSAAVVLWAASMAGGLLDELRGSKEHSHVPAVDAGTSPTGTLFGLAAAAVFLQTGGAGRVVVALNCETQEIHSLLARVVHDLLSGVHIAIALAVPFVIASVIFDVATAFVARALGPIALQSLWAPLKTLFMLVCVAVMLERVLSMIVMLTSQY